MEEMIRLLVETIAFVAVMGMVGIFVGTIGTVLAIIWAKKNDS